MLRLTTFANDSDSGDSGLNATAAPTTEPSLEPTGRSVVLQVCLMIVLFVFMGMMTASVSLESLKSKFRHKGVLVGLFTQFFLSPLFGLLTVSIPYFDEALNVEEKVVLLVIMSSPGGAFSNLLCSIFNADLALSVTMTAISTISSAAILPLNMFLYVQLTLSEEVELNFLDLSYTIIAVESGIVFGIFLKRYFTNPRSVHRFSFVGTLCGILLLGISVGLSQSEESLGEKSLGFFFACLMPVVFSGTTSVLLSTAFRLDKPERLAIAVECAYQNTSMGTAVAFTTFSLSAARIAVSVSVVNGLFQFIVSVVFLTIGWKAGWSFAPSNTGLCKMLFVNYQPQDEQDSSTDKLGPILADGAVNPMTTEDS